MAEPEHDYRERYYKQMDYSVALQQAIEYHCKGMAIPPAIARQCPHHAQKLNERLPTGGASNVR